MRMPSLLRRFFAERDAKLALVLLAPFLFFAVFANAVAPYAPLLYTSGAPLQAPTAAHLMGTDQAGSDIYSQVIFGSRVALYDASVSALVAVVLALAVGLTSGYFGGFVDEALMRGTDLVISIPSFVLIILVVILFGSTVNTIALIIAAVAWPTLARIVRAEVLSLKEREFVLAARAVGAGSVNIMTDEILPNVWFRLMPAVTLQMGLAIIIEAGISFLGLGDPNSSSWGRILELADQSVYSAARWGIFFPTVAIIATIVGLNLLGDSLAKAINPKRAAR